MIIEWSLHIVLCRTEALVLWNPEGGMDTYWRLKTVCIKSDLLKCKKKCAFLHLSPIGITPRPLCDCAHQHGLHEHISTVHAYITIVPRTHTPQHHCWQLWKFWMCSFFQAKCDSAVFFFRLRFFARFSPVTTSSVNNGGSKTIHTLSLFTSYP